MSGRHPLLRRVRALALPALAAAMLSIGVSRAHAQVPGEELEIAVVTMGQGDQVWERFGHNALWIRDRSLGTDVAWNWGLFDFAAPDFVLRFVTGETRYWMEGHDLQATMQLYRRLGRGITVQRLALTPAQRVAIRDHVLWNAREENRYYRYDYYLDNCSTRLRDVIDRALGGALKRATHGIATATTYRSESVRLTEGMALVQGGITTALGQPADVPISAWEQMFVPMRLRDRLRDVRVPGPDGTPIPLVAEEYVEYEAPRTPEPELAPSLFSRFAIVGVALALVVAMLGWLATRRSEPQRGARTVRVARVALAAIGSVWGLAGGVVALALIGAWVGTHHIFWFRNENLFQLSPVSLALAVLAPLAMARARHARIAARAAALVAALALLGLALKALPWFRQQNLEVVALALPVHLALAWSLWRVARAAAVTAPAASR